MQQFHAGAPCLGMLVSLNFTGRGRLLQHPFFGSPSPHAVNPGIRRRAQHVGANVRDFLENPAEVPEASQKRVLDPVPPASDSTALMGQDERGRRKDRIVGLGN
jgi:hypothetical protein